MMMHQSLSRVRPPFYRSSCTVRIKVFWVWIHMILCANMVVLGANPVLHIISHIFMSLIVYSDSSVQGYCYFSAAVVLYIVNMVLMVFSVCFSLILVVHRRRCEYGPLWCRQGGAQCEHGHIQCEAGSPIVIEFYVSSSHSS